MAKGNGHTSGGKDLTMVNYRILSKRYSAMRAICAEFGCTDTELLRALRDVHKCEFDSLHDDPELFIIQDTHQMVLFSQQKVAPTFAQLILTSKAIGLDKEATVAKWFEVMRRTDAEEWAAKLTDAWGFIIEKPEETLGIKPEVSKLLPDQSINPTGTGPAEQQPPEAGA